MIKSDVEYCKIWQNNARMFGIEKMNNLSTFVNICSARCDVSVSFQTFQAQVFQRNANVAERLRSWSTTSSKVRHSASQISRLLTPKGIKQKEYISYNIIQIYIIMCINIKFEARVEGLQREVEQFGTKIERVEMVWINLCLLYVDLSAGDSWYLDVFGDLQVLNVSGDHFSMLHEPHVGNTAMRSEAKLSTRTKHSDHSALETYAPIRSMSEDLLHYGGGWHGRGTWRKFQSHT